MNIQSTLKFFFPSMFPEQNTPRRIFLNPEDQSLYDKIVYRLLDIYSHRYVHNEGVISPPSYAEPQVSAIFFRQSKSWRKVQNQFQAISSAAQTNDEARNWANEWIDRIELMRKSQNSVRETIKNISKAKQQLDEVSKQPVNTSSRETSSNIKKIKSQINQLTIELQREQTFLFKFIDEGERDIATLIRRIHPHSAIAEREDCSAVIKFIEDNWNHLIVFLNLPEISLDDETIGTQVKHLRDPRKDMGIFDQLINPSTKYIFLVQEEKYEESPFDAELNNTVVTLGNIFRPAGVALLDEKIYTPEISDTPQSSKQRNPSSIKIITDGIISFADAGEDFNPHPAEDETLKKIRTIVSHALNDVNQRLERENSKLNQNHAVKHFPFPYFDEAKEKEQQSRNVNKNPNNGGTAPSSDEETT